MSNKAEPRTDTTKFAPIPFLRIRIEGSLENVFLGNVSKARSLSTVLTNRLNLKLCFFCKNS